VGNKRSTARPYSPTRRIGGVLRGQVPPYIMMAAGGVSAVIFLSFGIAFSVKEKKEKEA